MSASTDSRRKDDLSLLDEFLHSEDLWVERSEHARTLADKLLGTSAPIVILYGAPESGKTELIRRDVIPLLTRPVLYLNGELPEIEAVPSGGFLFIDAFEQLLMSKAAIDRIASQLVDVARRQSTTLVFVVPQDHLSQLFQIQQAVPRLMEAAYEVPYVSSEVLFAEFVEVLQERGVAVDSSVLDTLFAELQALSGKARLNPELLGILAFEFNRLSTDGSDVTKADYEAWGRLAGILEAHLDFLFETVSDRFESQMMWVILSDVVGTSGQADAELLDIANRFDVSPAIPASIIAWLEKDRGLLQKDSAGHYSVVPRQLSSVIADRLDRDRDRDADDHLVLMLRQATRQFVETGALLSESTFKKIHARRSSIRVEGDEAKLMVACALTYECDRIPGATQHWIKRLKDGTDAVDVLLDCTFDSRPEIRQRAVAQLGACKQPEVRNQLHLLALRDPADAVREQAIESLCLIQDTTLRNALIQEAKDLNSPYRLRCIEALRIFKDSETIETLVGIIRNPAAGDDRTARATAARVLGQQDSEQSAHALLDIALNDEKVTNRQNASVALGLMKSEEAVMYTLEKLRVLKHKPDTASDGLSARSVVSSLIAAGAAAVVVALTPVIHGLLLFVLGKRLLGAAVTGIQILGLAAVATDSEYAAWLVLATLAAGFLIPTQIVLTGRRDRHAHSNFRCWIDRVLFTVDSLTVFLLVPGLAPILAGRIRRGLFLIGMEAAGIGLLIGSVFFRERFAAFAPLSMVFTWVPLLMVIAGAAFLVIAYAAGLITTTLEVFLMPERREWLRRVHYVYADMVRNPVASRIICARFLSDHPDESSWASKLVQRYATLLHAPLLQSWESASAAGRQRITSFMMRRPHTESLDMLKRIAPASGWMGWGRYFLATWNFSMSVWPRDLIVFTTLGLVALITFTTVLYAQYQNSPDRLMARAQDQALETSERDDAVYRLQMLASSEHPQITPLAVTGLERVLARGEVDDPILSSAITALGIIGTAEAAEVLRKFTEQPLSSPTAIRRGPVTDAESDRNLQLRVEAVMAIASMQSLGGDVFHILDNIANNAALAKAIRDTAAKATDDPVGRAQHKLDEADYTQAIADATRFLKSSSNHPRAQEARNILATSHLRLGTGAMDSGDVATARSHLQAAVEAAGDNSTAEEAVNLGLKLAYILHEQVALDSPAGYADTYEVLTILLTSSQLSPQAMVSVQSNFAEACITNGRYDEGRRVAEALLRRTDLDGETKLNMYLMIYSAHVLKGDEAAIAKAREQLLKYHASLKRDRNAMWSYIGIRNYVRGLAIPVDQKQRLWAVMDILEKT
jgi:HEAT repeat protein